MSCPSTSPIPIPSPPTSLSACAVPIGGSNSSILDTCCNGHINAIATYSAPNSTSNARAYNGCFQFCLTDAPDLVAGCLTNTLGEYEKGSPVFECFNTKEAKARSSREGYGNENGGGRARGRVGWGVVVVAGLGVVGAVVGGI